jgi:hypothetical protein
MNSSPVMVSILFSLNALSKAYEDNLTGKWKQDIEIPTEVSLEQSEEFLEGRNKEMFVAFMRGMLQWRPEGRKTAKDLLQDPWLNDYLE